MSLMDGRIGKAIQILQEIDKLLPEGISEWLGVDVFPNCREQGFTLSFPTDVEQKEWKDQGHHFTWAENRNSDEIVVYQGPGLATRFAAEHRHRFTKAQQEAEYRHRQYFGHDKIDHVAQHIVEGIQAFICARAKEGTEWEGKPMTKETIRHVEHMVHVARADLCARHNGDGGFSIRGAVTTSIMEQEAEGFIEGLNAWQAL